MNPYHVISHWHTVDGREDDAQGQSTSLLAETKEGCLNEAT